MRGLDFNNEGTNIAMIDYDGVFVVSNVQTDSILYTLTPSGGKDANCN